ncbi:SDR family oxidoreductase [Gordonia sp. NB41Y]|uniref:SDR family oxidoreductase n=1 Tax=Gordonia sp. NB41Y TaxID=875808 RepID=UPI0002BFBC8F|nr:SDR family oxidoreductase [Gordonia sp. NB41Y]EMP11053.1 short-chain dehydrogenase [Gordonia sp. NB41Y]WLP89643.1 SDR family oxidoreductase [Gordonia sp. NB41Y]
MTLRDKLFGKRNHDAVGAVLADRVIAVTGGARGIGLETATQLLAAGARVAIGDVDAEVLGKAAADLGVEGIVVDVTDRGSFTAFLDEVENRLGPVDVLINNAGIMPVGSFLGLDAALIRRTIDIDLLGVITGSQLAAARMVPRRAGHIVNIASVAGRLPMPGLAVYNAAKAGVIEFSEALDAELSVQGVRVSTVMPTFTNTGLITGLQTNRYIQTVEPEVVSAAVVDVIARPRTRVAAPGFMRWVDANPSFPQALKRLTRRQTGLDRIFLDVDSTGRADYDARIRGGAVASAAAPGSAVSGSVASSSVASSSAGRSA